MNNTYFTTEDFVGMLKQKFPTSITIPIQEVDFNKLKIYHFYPNERNMEGLLQPDRVENKLNNFLAKVTITPEHYHLLVPNEKYYSLAKAEEGLIDIKNNLITSFIEQHPVIKEGEVTVNLKQEDLFLNCFYVEDRRMDEVTDILLHHPQIQEQELKAVLQLLNIRELGVDYIDKEPILVGLAYEMTEAVTTDYQHYYVGEGNPLQGHKYYQQDIRPKYSDKLKERADLELRKIGIIKTRPQSLSVRWCDPLGNNRECREMTKIINDLYKGYAEKIVDAYQKDNWTRVNIYTSNPTYQKNILDTINKSWAKQEVIPITDMEELPEEIAEAWRHEAKQCRDSFKTASIGVFGELYFFEEKSRGYVRVGFNRQVTEYGYPLQPENREYINNLVASKNYLQYGNCRLKPLGPEKLFLDKITQASIRLYEETVGDDKVLISLSDYSSMELSKARYIDITGRVTDVTIGGKKGNLIRCKIDGKQQCGRVMTFDDIERLKMGWYTPEQTAARTFFDALVSQEEKQTKSYTR